MQIKRERLRVLVNPRAEMSIWDDLRQDFKGYVHEVKSQYWKAFHLPFVESGEAVPGEVFFADPNIIMYYMIDPSRQFIEAGCVLPRGDGEQVFQGFCERIKDNVLPGFREREPFWTPHVDRNPAFDLVKEEAQRLTPSPEQLEAASALSATPRREMLRTIFQQRSTLMETLANGRPVMEIGQDVQLLEGLGLVQKEFVVFCREGGNQISRVNNLSLIEDATRRGFKCFSCGRPIAEERIDQLLSCTSAGNILARPNYWLGLVVCQGLERLGIQRTDMLMVPSGHQAVIDLFANHDGALLMFEIKESSIRLDDVFLFFSRLRYYRPEMAFFITTRPVNEEVRKYLAHETSIPVTLVEDAATLEEQVRRQVFTAQREHVRQTVDRLVPLTQVDVGDIVYEFFFGKEEHLHEVIDEAPKAVEPPPPHAEPPPPVTEEPVAEAPGDTASAVAEAVDQAAVPPEPVLPTEAPAIELAASTDTATAEPPAPMTEAPMQLHEEIPIIEDMQEVFEMDDFAPLEKPFEEHREQVFKKAVDDLNAQGVLGRSEALEGLLAEITALPKHGAALVDADGLLLAEALRERAPAELTAGVTLELHDSIQRGLEELGWGRVSRIQIDSAVDRLYVRTTERGVLMVVREERTPHEFEEEMVGTLPGEMVLREAMLKKVLEDLSMVEGLRGNLVAGRDGLLIESLLEVEDVPPDVLSIVFSQMTVDNERNLQRIGLTPLRQLLVRAGDSLFSLIPLDKEGILISLLDTATPREVWQNRLYAAANMLTSVFQ